MLDGSVSPQTVTGNSKVFVMETFVPSARFKRRRGLDLFQCLLAVWFCTEE